MRATRPGHFGPAVAPGEREAQGVEQLAPLLAGRLLDRLGQRLPRLGRPVELFGRRRGLLHQQPFVVAKLGRLDLAAQHVIPAGEVGEALEVGPQQQPILLARAVRQAIGDRGDIRACGAAAR